MSVALSSQYGSGALDEVAGLGVKMWMEDYGGLNYSDKVPTNLPATVVRHIRRLWTICCACAVGTCVMLISCFADEGCSLETEKRQCMIFARLLQ